MYQNQPTSYVITYEQIEQASQEKSEIFPWGYKEYRKVNGKWELSHLLITNEAERKSYKVYLDARPMETINWAARV